VYGVPAVRGREGGEGGGGMQLNDLLKNREKEERNEAQRGKTPRDQTLSGMGRNWKDLGEVPGKLLRLGRPRSQDEAARGIGRSCLRCAK